MSEKPSIGEWLASGGLLTGCPVQCHTGGGPDYYCSFCGAGTVPNEPAQL